MLFTARVEQDRANQQVKTIYPVTCSHQLKSETVFMKMFGVTLERRYHAFQKLVKLKSYVEFVYVAWIGTIIATFLLDNDLIGLTMLVTMSPFILLLAVHELYLKNCELCALILGCMECWLLLVQLILFSASVLLAMCSTFSAFYVAASILLAGIFAMTGDAYPAEALRLFRTFSFLMAATLIFIAVELIRFGQDTYQSCPTSYVSKGYPAVDFAVNRGFSTGFLLVRIVIVKTLRPWQCVILKSRVRIIEADIDSTNRESSVIIRQASKIIMKPDCQQYLMCDLPYQQLSLRESQKTMMDAFLGDKLAKSYRRMRRKHLRGWGLVMWVVAVTSFVLIFAFKEHRQFSFICSVISFISVTLYLVDMLSLMNYTLASKVLACFETWVLWIEVALFVTSLLFLLCFDASAALICLSIFLSSFPVILCDSYPMAKKVWWRMLIVVFASIFSFGVVYINLDKMERCLYRISTDGDVFLQHQRENTGYSFSVLNFCTNRGITFALLMWRIVYVSFRRPDNSTLLMSKLRIIYKLKSIILSMKS